MLLVIWVVHVNLIRDLLSLGWDHVGWHHWIHVRVYLIWVLWHLGVHVLRMLWWGYAWGVALRWSLSLHHHRVHCMHGGVVFELRVPHHVWGHRMTFWRLHAHGVRVGGKVLRVGRWVVYVHVRRGIWGLVEGVWWGLFDFWRLGKRVRKKKERSTGWGLVGFLTRGPKCIFVSFEFFFLLMDFVNEILG